MIKHLVICFLSTILLAACSARNSDIRFTIIDEVPEATKHKEALHDFLVAELAYKQEDLAKSYQTFQKISMSLEQPLLEVEERLYELHLLYANPEAARVSLEKMIILAPSEEKKLQLSLLKILQGEEYVKLNKEFETNNFKAAQEIFATGDRQLAITRLLILSQLFPEDSFIKFYMATIYSNAGNMEAALILLKDIDPKDKLYVRTKIFSALLLQQKKDLLVAEELLQDAMNEKPENQDLRNMYLSIIRDQDNLKRFKSELEIANEKFPENENFKFEYGAVLYELGEKERSLEILNQLIHRNPKNNDALNFVAYSYSEDSHDLDTALDYIQRALVDNPQNPYYLDTLAWVYYKQCKVSEALTKMREALKYLPDDPFLLEHYGDILKTEKRLNEAQDYYRESWREAQEREESREIRLLKKRLEKKLN